MATFIDKTKYLRKLQKSLMITVYLKENYLLKIKIAELANKNKDLLGATTASFRYNKKWYTDGFEIKWHEAHNYNTDIHPSLCKEIDNLLSEQSFHQIENKVRISNMIGYILNIASCPKDLKRLLPIEALTGMNLDPEMLIGEPLSDNQIQEIKDKNKDDLSYLTRLAMTKLLLSK